MGKFAIKHAGICLEGQLPMHVHMACAKQKNTVIMGVCQGHLLLCKSQANNYYVMFCRSGASNNLGVQGVQIPMQEASTTGRGEYVPATMPGGGGGGNAGACGGGSIGGGGGGNAGGDCIHRGALSGTCKAPHGP